MKSTPAGDVNSPQTGEGAAPNDEVARECWCGACGAVAVGELRPDDSSQFPLVRCGGCGVYALFPQPDDQTLAAAYSADYYGSSRRKFIGPVAATVAWSQARRAKMAGRDLPKNGSVLDVGCGNGGFLLQMKRRGFAVQGTEWSDQSAARVPAEIPVQVGDLVSLDLPAKSFDLITMWHVLEHVRQPYETLNRVHELLKTGGRVILELPNAESRQAQHFGTHWFHWDPPRHLFGFGPRSLSELLRLTGFEVDSIGTHSLSQNTYGFIQSWLNAKGFPRDRLYTMLKGLSHDKTSTRLADLVRLAVLLGPGFVFSTMEATRGCGATVTICARKIQVGDPAK